jgi:uncharacterized protein with GYD domain
MPLYMIQFAYTPEAKAALARVPEDRSVVFGQLVGDMGGHLNAFYNSLGEYDGVAIFEAPDEQSAHSIELAASQPGHLKETKILTLLPVQGKLGSDARGEQAGLSGTQGLVRQGSQRVVGRLTKADSLVAAIVEGPG